VSGLLRPDEDEIDIIDDESDRKTGFGGGVGRPVLNVGDKGVDGGLGNGFGGGTGLKPTLG
jgi:hypothetical protein